MSSHPLNLALRFCLELMALFSAGSWAWHQAEGWSKLLFPLSIVLLMSLIWGVFAVPNDPSRSGKTVVKTPGFIRLAIELFFFAFAIWALNDLGYLKIGLGMAGSVLLHYLLSIDRIRWLLKR